MRIIFIRHGKDDERFRGGWSTLDITEEGRAQARLLAKSISESKYNLTQIITSDLQRTVSTAEIIANELRLPVTLEPRLREINNGDLAGMPNEEALIRYPGLFFNSLEMNERYPNGESPSEFFVRIKTWFEGFTAENIGASNDILVVTHGGVINIIHNIVNGIEWSNKAGAFKTPYCGMYIVTI